MFVKKLLGTDDVLRIIRDFDSDLEMHCTKTAELAGQVGWSLGLPPGRLESLKEAALLHDIGKVFVNPGILKKPGRLTEEERRAVDMHSLVGCIYLGTLGYPQEVAELVMLHHGYDKEHYGYPYHKENCFSADILRACDIYDAVTSKRPYHEAISASEALGIVRQQGNLAAGIIAALEAIAAKTACVPPA